MSASQQFSVVRCGSQFELLAQLGDIARMQNDDRPAFPLTVRHDRLKGAMFESEIKVHIDGIVAEDGSGVNWIIQGYIRWQDGSPGWLVPAFSSNGHVSSLFNGFLNTRRRTGFIRPGSILA